MKKAWFCPLLIGWGIMIFLGITLYLGSTPSPSFTSSLRPSKLNAMPGNTHPTSYRTTFEVSLQSSAARIPHRPALNVPTYLSSITPFCPSDNSKEKIVVYKGKIEEAADYIVHFPTEEEGQQTYARLNEIVDSFRSILSGEAPIELEDIQEKCQFVLDTFKQTEILEWCLLGLCLDGEISLLPGEGIELTLNSYCLDSDKAGPSEEEFYSIESISEKEAEWLVPLLEYASRHPDEDLPTQGLIWNMELGVAYDDLPEDQQQLLSTVVPDAKKRYGKKLGQKILGRLKEEIRSRVEIIRDVESMAAEINERRSKLKLILPKYDSFQLENGLLVKVKSTGYFYRLKLVIVNPRERVLASGVSFPRATASAIKSIRVFPQGRNDEDSLLSLIGLSVGNLKIGIGNVGATPRVFPGTKGFILRNDLGIGILSWMLPPGETFPLSPFVPQRRSGQWGKAKDWWNRNKGRIESWSDRASDVKGVIDSYNERGLEGVGDYVKGRGFDEGLDFFKGFHKGNPEAERAFELFRDFNKSFLDAEKDKDNRGNRRGLKPFRPSRHRYKPGRGDVQPLAASGGF